MTNQVSRTAPTGHAWARMAEAVALARLNTRTQTIGWNGILSVDGWRMPSGKIGGLRDRTNIKRAHLLSSTLAASARQSAGRVRSIATVILEPAREKLLRGGAVRLTEADLLFAHRIEAIKGPRMVSAAIPVVGGIIIARAMADGFLELVPISLDPADPMHEVTSGGMVMPVSRFVQCRSDGFADPRTEAPLLDFSRLDLHGSCHGLDGVEAGALLSEVLLGPANDLLGNPFEAFASAPAMTEPETPRFALDAGQVANLLGCGLKYLVWAPPRSQLGFARVIAVEAKDERSNAIARLLFAIAAQPMAPETIADDPTTEPAWPWNPRRSPRRRIDFTPEANRHDQFDALPRIAAAWHQNRNQAGEAWRFFDENGHRYPDTLLSEIDTLLPRPTPEDQAS